MADFQIWKPPPGWLSYTELAARLADPESNHNSSRNTSRRLSQKDPHSRLGKAPVDRNQDTGARLKHNLINISRKQQIKMRMETNHKQHE